MREFIYYSKSAPTTGNFGFDLMKAGRLDIAIHSIIATFFLSHKMREDVKMHLVFDGPPNPPRHLEMKPVTEGKTGEDKIYFSKKDVGRVIKIMLYKYKKDKKWEVFPGFWIEKKGLVNLVKELKESGKTIYLLDEKGVDIRVAELDKDPIFLLGDHDGLQKREVKELKNLCVPVSIGKRTYFASQTIAIVNNELDRREDN